MRNIAAGLGVGALLVVVGIAAPAYPESETGFFSAEAFAAPSYHVVEIPKVEEGGEGFSWAYVNQTPESWGRSFAFWAGPTPETVFQSSVPQQGPLAGRRWRAPGSWTSYPPGGNSNGDINFGEPVKGPLGPTVDTPGGRLRLGSFSGHSDAEGGTGDFAFTDFQAAGAPVSIGFARSFAQARREAGAAVGTGWAVTRNLRMGDVTIDEIRSEASVRATTAGETATWKLVILGFSAPGQPRQDLTFSSDDHGDQRIQAFNEMFAGGAEQRRSEFRIVPGRLWKDDGGAHAESGFLKMGHRPVVTENSLFQKLGYAISFSSARALYRGGDPAPELEAPVETGDLPVASGATAPPPAAEENPALPVTAAERGEASVEPPLVNIPAAGTATDDQGIPGVEEVRPPFPSLAAPPLPSAPLSGAAPFNGAGRTGPRAGAPLETVTAGLGREAAREVRRGMGLVAVVAGVGMAVAVGMTRRQLALRALANKAR
ncbi:MAG: hypothetical protein AB1679_14440 [Actinomycetota bacterium]